MKRFKVFVLVIALLGAFMLILSGCGGGGGGTTSTSGGTGGGGGGGTGGGGVGTASAGMTNEAGQVILNIAGQNITFEFKDETTGNPIQGVAVGFGLDPNTKAQGVLIIIDPNERYSPQIIILQGPPASTSALKTARLQAADSNFVNILLPKGPNTVIGKIVLNHLPPIVKKVDDVTGFLDLVGTALTILNDTLGDKLGKYAGKLGIAERQCVSQAEAIDELRGMIKETINAKLAFFMGEGLKIGGLTPQAIFIDLMNLAAPANATLFCGLPGQSVCSTTVKISNTELFKFYACTTAPVTWDTTSLVRVNVSSADGASLSNGSLELFSKAAVGLGIKQVITGGTPNSSVSAEVPEIGDYRAVVRVPQYYPESINLTPGGTAQVVLNSKSSIIFTGPFTGSTTEVSNFGTIQYDVIAYVTISILSGDGTLIDPYKGTMKIEGSLIATCTANPGWQCKESTVNVPFSLEGTIYGPYYQIEGSAGDGQVTFTHGYINTIEDTLTGTLTFDVGCQYACAEPIVKNVTLIKK